MQLEGVIKRAKAGAYLESIGSGRFFFLAQFLHETCVRFGNFAAHAQRIVHVQVGQVSVRQKVARQQDTLRETLQRRIHETRISQIY